MANRACSRQLMKVLTTPSKVANSLDWRKATGGTIATIDVHASRIGITISEHPDTIPSSSPLSSKCSYSLPFREKGLHKIPTSSRQQLADLVNEYKVCGYVVSWPLQSDTGLMGASCGRTLYAIEKLLETLPDDTKGIARKAQRSIFSPSRLICLWNGMHSEQPNTDTFGRSSVYARTSRKTEYCASKEQYHQDESIVAANIWEDFVHVNWPHIYEEQQQIVHEQPSVETNTRKQQWDADSGTPSQQQRRTIMAA